MSGRFDYVKYDELAQQQQATFKGNVEHLEAMVNQLGAGENQTRALVALEEFYMWVGKAIRDEQIKRNGKAELQEERNNS